MLILDLINPIGVIFMKNPTLFEKPRLTWKERFEDKEFTPTFLIPYATSVNKFLIKLSAAFKSKS